MRVFVTGATGFIGSAVVAELVEAGHRVVGLARSDDAAAALAAAGFEAHRGNLDDPDSLERGAAGADGVAHLAFNHDFSTYVANGELDRRALEALVRGLGTSEKPLVMTSVTPVLTLGRLGTEDDATDSTSPAAPRIPSEDAVIAASAQGVRGSVVRLPASVHGDGDRAFVPALMNIARETGVSAYIGDGSHRWPAVHRLDAARLFRLALEAGAPGSRYHAVADEGVRTREIAEVIGRHLGVPVASVNSEKAAAHFGWIAGFFAMDNPTSSMLTRARLGWVPTHPGLLADLERPGYFAS